MILAATVALVCASTANAAPRFSVANGNWNATATWSATSGGAGGASFPVAGDDVTIEGTHTVTITAAAACATLTISSGSTLTEGAFSLTVSGTTTVGGTLTHNSATGTMTLTGDVTISGTLSETAAGPFVYGGNVTINSTGTLTESGAATMSCAGSLQNDGTYTASTGVHTFSGTTQTFSGAHAISIASVTVSGTYQNNGTLTVNTALAGSGTLTQNASASSILNIGGTSATFTFVASGSGNTVNYTSDANQTVKQVNYQHLGLSGVSTTKTMTGVTNVSGNLSFSGSATATLTALTNITGNLTLSGTTTVTLGVALTVGGDVTIGSGMTLDVSASNFGLSVRGNWSNSGTFTQRSGTVTFNGDSGQSIGGSTATTFSGLTINNGSGVNILTGPTVGATLTLTSGALSIGANTLTLNAGITTTGGSLTGGSSSSISFATIAGGATTLPAVSGGLLDLTVNRTAGITLGGAVSVSGTLTLTVGTFAAGTSLTMAAGSSIVRSNGGAMTGTVQGANAYGVTYTGTGMTTGPELSGAGLRNVTVNLTAGQTLTLGASRSPNGDLTVTSGNLDLNALTFSRSAAGGTFTLANGTTLLLSGAANFPANYSSVSLGATSTVTYDFAGAQTVSARTYGNLTIAGASGTKTLAASATVNGTLTLTANTFDITAGLTLGNGATIARASGSLSGTPTFGSSVNVSYSASVTTGTEIPADSAKPSNLTISGGTITLGGAVTVNGSVTMTGGTLDTSLANNYPLTVVGNLNVGAGSLTARASTITVGGDFTGTGTFTAGTSTFVFNGTGAQSILTATSFGGFYNLNINKSSGTATCAAVLTVGGALTVTQGVLSAGADNLTVTGNTSLYGTLTISSTTGTKTFTGDVTINLGGTWNETAAEDIGLAGNLQNDGTFTALGGTHSFSGSKTVGGTHEIVMSVVSITGTRVNNGTLTVSTTLGGAGTLQQGASGTLNFGGTLISPTLTATAAGNTVNYNGIAAQTVKATTYSNLILNGGGWEHREVHGQHYRGQRQPEHRAHCSGAGEHRCPCDPLGGEPHAGWAGQDQRNLGIQHYRRCDLPQ